MGIDFDSAGNLLSSTMRKLGQVTATARGRNYLFWTVILFITVAVIIFIKAIF